jgi:hypothetical protein
MDMPHTEKRSLLLHTWERLPILYLGEQHLHMNITYTDIHNFMLDIIIKHASHHSQLTFSHHHLRKG